MPADNILIHTYIILLCAYEKKETLKHVNITVINKTPAEMFVDWRLVML